MKIKNIISHKVPRLKALKGKVVFTLKENTNLLSKGHQSKNYSIY